MPIEKTRKGATLIFRDQLPIHMTHEWQIVGSDIRIS